MEWLEVTPIPDACRNCAEGDCYNCDTAGHRWVLAREEELRLTRKLKEKTIVRLQQEIAAIDRELQSMKEGKR